MSAPQSNIYICSGVRLNSRYEHSIHFASAAAQASYFESKTVKTFTGYTYLRKSWSIKVDATMAQARSWSYLYFRNGSAGKVYYYFINNIEYVNDRTVELSLELDVLQTYMFDYTLLPSYVERQHVEDDTIGAHTQDEGLDPGEYNASIITETGKLDELCILVLSTITLNGTTQETTVNAYGNVYGRVFSGLSLSAVEMTNWANFSRQLDNLSTWGKIDGIVAMWMYPKNLVKLGGLNIWGDDITCKVVAGVNPIEINVTVPAFQTFEGYAPRNNKLWCYPYNFLYVTNNNGGTAAYHFERFIDKDTMHFTIRGATAPDAGCTMIAQNYRPGTTGECLSIGAYPSCSWDSDTYKIWLAQNQNTHDLVNTQAQLKVLAGGLAAGASIATGNILGAGGGVATAVSGYSDIASLLATKADRAIEPPQARGTFSANINVAANMNKFVFYRKWISAEYARRIDDYFTLYGYKINRVQTPNRHARKAFTYVKTIGCHIAANLCNEDTVKIESIYDQGITWWVNGDSIGNYDLDNSTL